jgi:hypothetical protein
MNHTANRHIPLCKQQKEIMQLFYAVEPTKIVLSKEEYDELWTLSKNGTLAEKQIAATEKICPAIVCEIQKSKSENHLIQSAVFSECVYAQTLANTFRLSVFTDYEQNRSLNQDVLSLLQSYNLVPRYVFSNENETEFLVQAGGCGGVDSALIHLVDNASYSIEFKEPGARATTADLPKYGEDGKLVVTTKFLNKYPFFKEMLEENRDLNFFETMGSNTYSFSQEALKKAVTTNYNTVKKYADVIVTADKDDFLVMLPANQVDLFARIEGEIRGARNKSKIFTPKKLKYFIEQLGGIINGNEVSLELDKLTSSIARGGTHLSRYKINPLFFISAKDTLINNDIISFNFDKVQQLIPCITTKMFFEELSINEVINYYKEDLQ